MKNGRDFIKTHIFPGGCLPSIESLRRVDQPGQRPHPDRTARLRPALRRDPPPLAGQPRGPPRRVGGHGPRRALRSPVAVLPLLLRGRVRRARHQRGPVPAGPPGLPATRALPQVGQTGRDGPLESTAPTGRHAALGGALPALRARRHRPAPGSGGLGGTTCAGWPSAACPAACSTTSTARPRTSWHAGRQQRGLPTHRFRPRVLRGRRRTSTRRPRCSASRSPSRSCWRRPGSPASPIPQGELAVARAAGRAGLPYTLSTLGTRSIEEVRRVSDGARKWFQVYVWRDRGLVQGHDRPGRGRPASRRSWSRSTRPCSAGASATCAAGSRCRPRSGWTR